MYNGIGLRTVRGSGTSGHVQANSSLLKAKAQIRRLAEQKSKASLDAPSHDVRVRKANPDILEHERKRKVEIELIGFRDKLEALGIPEDDIDVRVEAERKRLREDPRSTSAVFTAVRGATESHVMAAAKAADDARLRSAFGIAAAHVEGQAFDRELQAKRRDEAKEARESKQREMEEQRRQRDEAARVAREDRERNAAAEQVKVSAAVRSTGSGADSAVDRRIQSQTASSRKRSTSPTNARGRRSARSPSRSDSYSSRSRSSCSQSSRTESSHSRSHARRSSRSYSVTSRSSKDSRSRSLSPRSNVAKQRTDGRRHASPDPPPSTTASAHDRTDASGRTSRKPVGMSSHAGRKRYRSHSNSGSSSSRHSRARSASTSPKRARHR
jgi:serine/arginine repetitive matrix protein 2